MAKPLRVLIVEDSPDDAALLLRELRRGGYEPVHERVETAAALRDALRRESWDIVLSDYVLPRFSGRDALELVKESGLDLPFIIVSGTIGEETAVEAMRAGAHDYLMKGRLARLVPAVERELQEVVGRRARRGAEEAVDRRDAILKAIVSAANRLLRSKDWHRSVREVLARLGEATRVSRVYVYENRPGPGGEPLVSLRHEWVAPGIAAKIEDPALQRFPLRAGGFGRWEKALARRRALHGLVRELPPPERRVLATVGIRSFATVPIFVENAWWGFMGFDDFIDERRWSAAELDALKTAADTLGGAIQLQRSCREAQEANRAKDEFLSTLSHELRTPLTSILGWAQMLQTGSLDEATAARGLELIFASAKQQSRLVEDLLDISRIVTGKLRLHLQAIPLEPTVAAAIDSLRPAAEAKRIRLDAQLDPAAAPVLGDPERLQQVVWNLLSNAIKFTPEAGRVDVRLERVASHARIRVSDSGKGIPAEFLPHLFERLRQADASTTRFHGGLGLGLSIVRNLVEAHGGTVEAESAGEGRGATFTVTLPLTLASLPESRSAPHPDRQADGAAPALPALQGLRMLVVDDEPATLELIKAALESSGAEVTAVGSAAEALEEIDRSRPDVLVSDIAMPGEDGYSLIRKVRARRPERGGWIPAAALTAHARGEDRRKAISAGFQAYVAKPVEPLELAEVVATLACRRGER